MCSLLTCLCQPAFFPAKYVLGDHVQLWHGNSFSHWQIQLVFIEKKAYNCHPSCLVNATFLPPPPPYFFKGENLRSLCFKHACCEVQKIGGTENRSARQKKKGKQQPWRRGCWPSGDGCGRRVQQQKVQQKVQPGFRLHILGKFQASPQIFSLRNNHASSAAKVDVNEGGVTNLYFCVKFHRRHAGGLKLTSLIYVVETRGMHADTCI